MRIVIEVKEGCVHEVYSEEPVEVLLLDYDNLAIDVDPACLIKPTVDRGLVASKFTASPSCDGAVN